jgi:hypothetical protein
MRLSKVPLPVVRGVVGGAVVAASPLGFWWLPPATVYACGLLLIASVYIGFSVADGRPKIIAVEVAVATAFVVRAPRVPRGLVRQPVQRQVRFEGHRHDVGQPQLATVTASSCDLGDFRPNLLTIALAQGREHLAPRRHDAQ